MVKTPKRFTVSDGTLMLVLEVAEEGGYLVTSPIDPELFTQAETVEEAFEMAYDVVEGLNAIRAERTNSSHVKPPAKKRRKSA